MKCRRGIHVTGAQVQNGTGWQITTDIHHKHHSATVTAYVTDKELYSKIDRYIIVFLSLTLFSLLGDTLYIII